MEDKELIKRMKEAFYKEIKAISSFWQDIYPAMNKEEKIAYWSDSINQQLRWQAESGLDPYAIFNPDWYANSLNKEPEFDEIIDVAFREFLSWEWSKQEYLKRIGKVL